MIKVLIVDDSLVARELLNEILGNEEGIEVVGVATDGIEAVEMAAALSPDLITMDINMPRLDGIRATRQIMDLSPTRILIVSGIDNLDEVASSFGALDAGALAVMPRPGGTNDPSFQESSHAFVETVRTYAEVMVVRHWRVPRAGEQYEEFSSLPITPRPVYGPVQLIAMGASAGGPPVVREILSILPVGLPVPIILVQHMAPGFVTGFAGWLAGESSHPIHVAEDRAILLPGHVYIAPDGYHLGVEPSLLVNLLKCPLKSGICPSVTYLFRSVAASCGPGGAGVLLSGMGEDGASGLLSIREAGGLTIAQDRETSMVYGMPGAAVAIGAVQFVKEPSGIADLLCAALKG
jgi:two-component system chemotaxis response regulator CheB